MAITLPLHDVKIFVQDGNFFPMPKMRVIGGDYTSYNGLSTKGGRLKSRAGHLKDLEVVHKGTTCNLIPLPARHIVYQAHSLRQRNDKGMTCTPTLAMEEHS